MALCVVLFVPTLSAQTATGSIVGRVTDPTGAVVAGVEVTVANPVKGFTARTTSGEQGIYRFLYLEPATYNMTFQHSGFSALDRPGVILRSNETISVDVALTVGSISEKIEVTAATPLLETATSTTGATLAGVVFNKLPNAQRTIWMTMYVMPGVTGMNAMNVAGQRSRNLTYTMDGVSGTEPLQNMGSGNNAENVTSTTQSAIEEVKVVTTVLPAEYGHTAAGMISTTYKSGTNELHLDAEDRYLPGRTRHREFFQLNKFTTPFTYHIPSVTVSGPLVLPKVYDGRNKTFFLFGWQLRLQRSQDETLTTVPTPEMLNGDFSFGGKGYPIFDPSTVRQDAAGKWIADPFAGNIIPKSRFDPVASKFLSYNPWLAPNNWGNAAYTDAAGPHNNFGGLTPYQGDRSGFDIKIDHVFNEQNRLFGRYSQTRNRVWGMGTGLAANWQMLQNGTIPPASDQPNIVLSDVHMFSPHLINEFRVGMTRRKVSWTPFGMDEGWAQTLGIPGVGGEMFPYFRSLTSFAGGWATTPYYRVSEQVMLQNSVSYLRASHNVKIGYELNRTRANMFEGAYKSGDYTFGATGQPFTPNSPGNSFAAFLLGSVTSATFGTPLANWLPRWWMHSLFIQDDWNVSRRLTLNIGLRWSYETPFQTKYGQQSQFDPNATDPVTGLRGAIVHGKFPLSKGDWNNFQPRVGLAYRFTDKMVFRGGFGLNTIDILGGGSFRVNFEEYTTSVNAVSPSGDPRPAFFLSKGPGPLKFNILPDGSSPFVGANYSGRTATWMDPVLRNPYATNWNLSYQYQFLPTWMAELSYQGSSGVGLLNSWNTNVLHPDTAKGDTALLDKIYQNSQIYKPYTQFGNVNLWSNFGHSTYHSGTIRVEKRFSHGLDFNAFYTWAKTIDEADNDGGASGVSYYNRSLEKGVAGFDLRHRYVVTTTYELPIGKGRKWMNRGGIINYLLGGWDIAWIQNFQSALPATLGIGGSPYRYLPTVGIRPNQLVPTEQVYTKDWDIGQRFDNNLKNPCWIMSSFAYPSAYSVGTVGRNTLHGCNGMNWSRASISKTVTLKDKYNMEIRFDVQDVFKNTYFTNPSATVNFTTPGTFGKPTGAYSSWCCLSGPFVGIIGVRAWF
ncbi:MAG: TonB-dependent receptor [Bryobacterales bacterium]|nr:TonB-dependent receptor [Bryobacterales bacterium]